MEELDTNTPSPTEIKLHQKSRMLEISFADGTHAPRDRLIEAAHRTTHSDSRPRRHTQTQLRLCIPPSSPNRFSMALSS